MKQQFPTCDISSLLIEMLLNTRAYFKTWDPLQSVDENPV